MLPVVNDDLINDFTITETPSKTFKLNTSKNTITGYTDEIEALKQAIYLIINVERYKHLIYSWNYGVELDDLFGQPTSYVLPELKRRIEEALVQDDRINSVDSFSFSVRRGKVAVAFTAHTIYGEIETGTEVNI